jgi:hypothetical protein
MEADRTKTTKGITTRTRNDVAQRAPPQHRRALAMWIRALQPACICLVTDTTLLHTHGIDWFTPPP